MKRYKKVAVGGTFDQLHLGHHALLKKAFELGDLVIIGITTDEMVKALHKPHEVAPYSERRIELEEFLRSQNWFTRAKFFPLNDPYGPTLEMPDLNAIVVSKETEHTAREINKLRQINGLSSLDIIVIDTVLAEDSIPISTTRIRLKEIDRNGHVLSPKQKTKGF
jgi:pantetheine-phosphate adenylyltransferase